VQLDALATNAPINVIFTGKLRQPGWLLDHFATDRMPVIAPVVAQRDENLPI